MTPWRRKLSQRQSEAFARAGVEMTLGGEPTFLPLQPLGAEWNHAAVGPTKYRFARKLALALLRKPLKGGIAIFSPGKSYPGEGDPRWAIRILANRDGSPLVRPRSGSPPTKTSLARIRKFVVSDLGVENHWARLADPSDPGSESWALLIDECDGEWTSFPWPSGAHKLSTARGPAGLRLPLHVLPPEIPRRALTLEWTGRRLAVFLPPLLQQPFVKLLGILENALRAAGIGAVEMQGYTPEDETLSWTQLGLAADPGVLEINLPACANWKEYDSWIHAVTDAARKCGLRPWKKLPGALPEGTGGGNHLLWGGATPDRSPFFTRPGWLASILRYWHHHPSLAYLFTGCYVGASSQAPRADESARNLSDLELALSFLESLPAGDHRHLIFETLRHLQTDVTGNTHRSEISFDKFWNVGSPSGTLGLIEFRAIESLPNADGMSAVALLWTSLAAWLLEHPHREKLRDFSEALHDRFLLPNILWQDLSRVFSDLNSGGFFPDPTIYRKIWEWKFPVLLSQPGFTIRKAHESWPLLSETPRDGGTTSRYVDASMARLELAADSHFFATTRILVNNRPLILKKLDDSTFLAGLRYRRTNLSPSLHPGIPAQSPLRISLVSKTESQCFVLMAGSPMFRPARPQTSPPAGKPCSFESPAHLTCDLRVCP